MLQSNFTFLIQVHCLQNALFGMDIPAYDNGRKTGEFSILDDLNSEDISFDDDYLEVSKVNHAFQKQYDNLPFIEMKVPETQIEIGDGVWVKKRKVEPLLIWFDRKIGE